MFTPNLRRKIFGWLERLKNSAGIRLSHKKFGGGPAHAYKFGVSGQLARRRLRGLRCALCKWIESVVAEIWPFEIIQDGCLMPTWI